MGSGCTANIFISLLQHIATGILGVVAVSDTSASKLQGIGIAVLHINDVNEFAVYIDGADEVDPNLMFIEGGGLNAGGNTFRCCCGFCLYRRRLQARTSTGSVRPSDQGDSDCDKHGFCRHIRALGGQPAFRPAFKTDNENSIVDVRGLSFADPVALESALNQIPGVVQRRICLTAC